MFFVCLQVNSFVGAFHDAVILYAIAVNETLEDGLDPTNGTEITRRMWNRSFQGKLLYRTASTRPMAPRLRTGESISYTLTPNYTPNSMMYVAIDNR